ncbi:serine/threonine-protein kinase GRIK2 isoform X1 [Tanacetum coccineum]
MMIQEYSGASMMEIGCCGCFGFSFAKKHKKDLRPRVEGGNHVLQGLLNEEVEEDDDDEEEDNNSDCDIMTETEREDHEEFRDPRKSSQEILDYRTENGTICREFPVKETHKVIRSEDEDGNKMVNEYVRECKIGAGSYGKVVLYRSLVDGKHYAIKAFHKSHLIKLRVAPSETAMTDVLREVLIMKMLDHPNIVNLVEVIDDPNTDNFYMVLEYVKGQWVFEGAGPPGGLGETVARSYLRDIVSGLMYLHSHNIVHGDIKPDNLLVSATGTVKIGDFSVSQVFEDDNDELRRIHLGSVVPASRVLFRSKLSWQNAIVNNTLLLPEDMNPLLKYLIEGLLCKDPMQRMTLEAVSLHPWVMGDDGPIPQYLCWCKRNKSLREESNGNKTDAMSNTN